MRILFFKARPANADGRDASEHKEPLPDKIRRILVRKVQEAESEEDREHAVRELKKLGQG